MKLDLQPWAWLDRWDHWGLSPLVRAATVARAEALWGDTCPLRESFQADAVAGGKLGVDFMKPHGHRTRAQRGGLDYRCMIDQW